MGQANKTEGVASKALGKTIARPTCALTSSTGVQRVAGSGLGPLGRGKAAVGTAITMSTGMPRAVISASEKMPRTTGAGVIVMVGAGAAGGATRAVQGSATGKGQGSTTGAAGATMTLGTGAGAGVTGRDTAVELSTGRAVTAVAVRAHHHFASGNLPSLASAANRFTSAGKSDLISQS